MTATADLEDARRTGHVLVTARPVYSDIESNSRIGLLMDDRLDAWRARWRPLVAFPLSLFAGDARPAVAGLPKTLCHRTSLNLTQIHSME